MADIQLNHVTKEYADGHEAVLDLSLRIADGEFMILVGPSGCGKSTLLRMIAGLEEVSCGELLIDGELVNDRPPKDRDIAMVFQNYALYPHMSVRENLGFALKINRAPRAEIARRVESAAEILDLGMHLDRKPAQLSGGQRQRVAMGRAIVRDPKAFLLDEPLSNLDAKLRVEMRTQIALLQQHLGTTTVYVTHDQTEAMTLGDRVAVMRYGVLQQVGAPMELYERPANLFVAGFIGMPAMNLMPAQLDGSLLRLPIGEVELDTVRREAIAASDTPSHLIAGIRPESITDAGQIGDQSGGITFEARVDVLEAMGSELHAHFAVPGADEMVAAHVEAISEDAPGREPLARLASRAIVRLEPTSSISEGSTAPLWLDTASLHLFDAESGARFEPSAEPALAIA